MFKSKLLKNLFYKKKLKQINRYYNKNLFLKTSILEHFAYHYFIYYLDFLKEQESIPYKPLAFVNLQENRIVGTLKVLHNIRGNLPFYPVFKQPIKINNLKLIFNNKNFFNTYKSFNRLFYTVNYKQKTKHELLYEYLRLYYFNIIYQVFHGWYFNNDYYIFLKSLKKMPKMFFPSKNLKISIFANYLRRWNLKQRFRLNKLALGFFYKFLSTTELSGHDHHEMATPLKYALK
jgi:hypothetical protein